MKTMKATITSIISAIPVLVLIALFVVSATYQAAPTAVAMDIERVDESTSVVVEAHEPEVQDLAPSLEIPAPIETIPEVDPLEEFMSTLEDARWIKMYTELFEIYDYERFVGRSEIPQYFQSLYLNRFAGGTIKSSGCGISCLAMISTYLFEETVTPDMLTRDYYGDNPAWVMERQILDMKLTCVMNYTNLGDALDTAMANGNPVILLHRDKVSDDGRKIVDSIFTDGGHFVVCAGMTEDGRYIINDPNWYNLTDGDFTEEYMNGFTRDQVMKGLVGVYVFDTKTEFNYKVSLNNEKSPSLDCLFKDN